MKDWFTSLAACAVLAEIAQALAPKGWREHIGRIAAMAALIVLLAPFRGWGGIGRDLAENLPSLLTSDAGDEGEDGARDAWYGAAELVFRTAEKLGIDPASLTVRFREEEGALTEVRVTAPGCPWNLRAALEEELEGCFGAACRVTADAEEGRNG